MSRAPITCTISVNGVTHERPVLPGRTLAEFLREDLELTGTHVGCNNGVCGSCTVILDGEPVRACLLLAVQADGGNVTTIEGLMGRDGMHPLQSAFVEHGAVQCGFCIPGMIMTAKALLDATPAATRAQIRRSLEGNLCRCTGYVKIVEAVAAVNRAVHGD